MLYIHTQFNVLLLLRLFKHKHRNWRGTV